MAAGFLLLAVPLALPGCSGCSQMEQSRGAAEVAEKESQRAGESPLQTPPAKDAPPPQPDDSPGADDSSGAGQGEVSSRSDSSRSGSSSSETRSAAASSASGPASPAEALSQARQLQRSSRKQAAAGRTRAAFLTARDAWELVRSFPDSPACSSLADGLLTELDELADSLDRQNSSRFSTSADQTLIEK